MAYHSTMLDHDHNEEINHDDNDDNDAMNNETKTNTKTKKKSNHSKNNDHEKNNMNHTTSRRSSRITSEPGRFGTLVRELRSRPFKMDPNKYALLVLDEPISYQQAIECEERDKWLSAIRDELDAHKKNKTWSIIKRTRDMNVIDTRWVFKVKRDSSGGVLKYKARLVTKGFEQLNGIDFHDTFAPVLKYKSLRILIVLSLHTNSRLEQLDVNSVSQR
jgi:hypothetical protein